MLSLQECQQEMREILKSINMMEFTKELQVPDNEVFQYLDQLLKSIQKEISYGIYIIPLTGKQLLQKFIKELNTRILTNWLRGRKRKHQICGDVQQLIKQILQTFDYIEFLAVELDVTELLKLPKYIKLVLNDALLQYYQKQSVQVTDDLYLVPITTEKVIGAFFSILNMELSLKLLGDLLNVAEKDNKIIQKIENSEMNGSGIKSKQIKKKEHNISYYLEKFMRKFELKLLPDNQLKQFIVTVGRKMILNRREEEGCFFNQNNFQTFKVICKMQHPKFERGQFLEYMNTKQSLINIEFDAEKFEKLLLPPAETEGQLWLQQQLLKQIENTMINTREYRQYFHKYLCVELFEVVHQYDHRWVSGKKLNTSGYLYQEFKNPIGEELNYGTQYLMKYVYPLYRWQECLIQLLLKLKVRSIKQEVFMILIELKKDSKQGQCKAFLRFSSALSLLILIESEYLIGIQQTFYR